MKALLWIAATLAAAFSLIEVIGNNAGPRTYGEISQQEKDRCIVYKGNGAWRGSSGITLEKFCEAAGALKALQAERRDHPERF